MKELPKNYNFTEREEHWRKFWEDEGIYKFDESSDKPIYSVDTPPPYVSAEHLHTGHIMSYSQAEFVVRYKRMKGFNVYYPMGFDDNGLPTERFVEKKYKIDKSKITRKEFIDICLKETKVGAQNYKNLWQSLGTSVDWSKTYSTIDKHSQKISQWSFLDLHKKGKIYRAKKPVLWCTSCRTAIAQADLEAEERESKLYYIKAKAETGDELTFATTRPELLPACMGISVHPDDKRYKNLIGKKIILPLTGKHVYLSTDEEVDPKYGSGVVYFCSFGGQDCIDWLERHPEAKPIHALDPNGRFNEQAGKYAGLKMKDARSKIVEDLREIGALEKQEDLKNVTFVHERCSTDVEYISTEQWFINVLDSKNEFEKRGEELNWYPKFMHRIYKDWVTALKWDWCISRQRYYGVPFPLWYCSDCGEIVLADEKDLPIDPMNDNPKKPCPKCKGTNFKPEEDVMDTWMTSSLTPLIGSGLVQNEKLQKKMYPETLRAQAFEIIRTWLFYTIVKSHYHHDSLPFKDVMISGHGLDEQGRKISKRLGNYVTPSIIIEQFGADAMRYWATGASLGGNMRWNEDEVKKGKRTVTKLWNASRLAMESFDGQKKPVALSLQDEDNWILSRLNDTIKECTEQFDKHEYSKARNAIDNFFWNDFCDYYLEFVKYRIYSEDKVSKDSAIYTLYSSLITIIKLYAPILPFITEELYQLYFKDLEKDISIHISTWPNANKDWELAEKDTKEFEKALKVVDAVRAYKTKNGISLGKEIEEFKADIKLNENQRRLVCITQKVKKVISK